MFKKASLYLALAIAVMTTLLLLSYVFIRYGGKTKDEAALLSTPTLTTEVWGTFNPYTGKLRYGGKVDEVHSIASITKLYTAYAVLKSNKINATTTIGWADLSTEGDSGKLRFGEVYSLRDLLFPLLIESSNDSGTVVRRVLGENFLTSITEFLEAESLNNTRVVEPTGLSKENVSTVADLAHTYAVIRRDYPHLIDITQLRMYLGGSEGLINNNPIRSLPSFTGGKNGYTTEAGRTFVGTFDLGKGRGEIGIVLLGSTNVLEDVKSILSSYN